MKKATLIPVLFLILSLISVGCVPTSKTMPTITPTAKLDPTPIPPTATTQPTPIPPTATPEPTPIPPTATTQPTEVALEEGRYYEEEGGFSYIIPDGWQIFEIGGLKYFGLVESNPEDDMPSNVLFADEKFAGSLEEYVEATLNLIKQLSPNFEVMSTDAVETDSGIRGTSVVGTDEINGLQIIQVFFMFDIGERIFVMTYTSNIDENQENIIAIGDLMHSLQFDD